MIQYDNEGIPILSRCDIENKAIEFLQKYSPHNLTQPIKTNLVFIISSQLKKEFNLDFYWPEDLGINDSGYKILGRFKWLDPDLKNTSELKEMLIPYSSEEMEAYQISTFVNSPKNNSPKCISFES